MEVRNPPKAEPGVNGEVTVMLRCKLSIAGGQVYAIEFPDDCTVVGDGPDRLALALGHPAAA